MSRTNEELDTINDFQADLDFFISEKNWKEAAVVVDAAGELGFEHEALIMHQTLNRARAEEEKPKTRKELFQENQDANDERGL